MADADIPQSARGRNRVRRGTITPAMKQEIISRYLAGERPVGICSDYGLNPWNISTVTTRAGISRSKAAAQRLILKRREWVGNTRYSLNHATFSSVTPEAAYWAGFLMADGTVNGNKLRLKISTRDRHHLEKFRVFLGSDAPVVTDRWERPRSIEGRSLRSNGTAFITVASEQIVSDLLSFGITPQKTLKARVARLEMSADFWRGMIDGDGSIFVSGKKPYLSLVGTDAITAQFLAFCQTISPCKIHARQIGAISSVQMSAGTAYMVLLALYRNATTSLDRKAVTAQQILDRFHHYRNCG